MKPGYFSFNVPGGRCDVCEGAGSVIVEMHFLPDVVVPCDACAGTRYGDGARRIAYRGRNVSRILQMTVREALEFFLCGLKVAAAHGVGEPVGGAAFAGV